MFFNFFYTPVKFLFNFALTREVSQLIHADFNEIWICYREKKSKIDLFFLKCHIDALRVKKWGQKWPHFGFFGFFWHFYQRNYREVLYHRKGNFEAHPMMYCFCKISLFCCCCCKKCTNFSVLYMERYISTTAKFIYVKPY